MKSFARYLQEKGYAQNTVESYVFASEQLLEKVAQISRSLTTRSGWFPRLHRRPQTTESELSTSTWITSHSTG